MFKIEGLNFLYTRSLHAALVIKSLLKVNINASCFFFFLSSSVSRDFSEGLDLNTAQVDEHDVIVKRSNGNKYTAACGT